LKKFFESVLENTKNDILLNLKLLLIWGAGVGAVINQITNYLRFGFIKYTKFEVFLLLVTILTIVIDELKSVIQKKELLSVKKILMTINNTFYTFVNIISYAFIIPTLEISWEVSQSGYKFSTSKEIIIRFVMFGVISVFGNLSKEIISEFLNLIDI
jgi:hypothetical protein